MQAWPSSSVGFWAVSSASGLVGPPRAPLESEFHGSRPSPDHPFSRRAPAESFKGYPGVVGLPGIPPHLPFPFGPGRSPSPYRPPPGFLPPPGMSPSEAFPPPALPRTRMRSLLEPEPKSRECATSNAALGAMTSVVLVHMPGCPPLLQGPHCHASFPPTPNAQPNAQPTPCTLPPSLTASIITVTAAEAKRGRPRRPPYRPPKANRLISTQTTQTYLARIDDQCHQWLGILIMGSMDEDRGSTSDAFIRVLSTLLLHNTPPVIKSASQMFLGVRRPEATSLPKRLIRRISYREKVCPGAHPERFAISDRIRSFPAKVSSSPFAHATESVLTSRLS